MKKITKFLTLLLGICLMTIALADIAYSACSTTTCYGKITRVYISGGTLYIATDGNEKSLNCTSPAGVYVTIPTSDPMLDEKYATLLTAMSLGNKVGLRIIPGDPHCAVSYVYMDN